VVIGLQHAVVVEDGGKAEAAHDQRHGGETADQGQHPCSNRHAPDLLNFRLVMTSKLPAKVKDFMNQKASPPGREGF
jgi:hypothetical protein